MARPRVERARRLFAEVLDAPGGGLRIQTIHSFAQTLLASFPAEAGIAPGFRPIEGRAETELARRTLASLLENAEASGDEQLLDDVSALSLRLGEAGAEKYLMACARAHEAMEALGDPSTIEPRLLSLIGVEGGDPDEEILRRLGRRRDRRRPVRTADRRQSGVGHRDRRQDRRQPDGLPSAASRCAGRQCWTWLEPSWSPGKGEPCKSAAKQLAAEPDYESWQPTSPIWLTGLRTPDLPPSNWPGSRPPGLRAGQAFARAYVHAKRAAGVADFDDLIAWTRRLFDQPGMGEWVRYKLDQRTDHILVDEAQDTNSDQWAIVDALAGEYFSGNPEAEDRWRTLFMVGDYKQAIFGFQGTDPKEYEQFRARRFGQGGAVAGQRRRGRNPGSRVSRPVDRCQLPLLAAGAAAGRCADRRRRLSRDGPWRAAQSPPGPFHADRPGRVELWPAFEPAVER